MKDSKELVSKPKEEISGKFTYKIQRRILVFSFLCIPLLLLIVFSYLPMINMFYYSFHKWNGFSKTKEFLGLENYITLFTKPEYFTVFKVSLYYLGGSFIQMALALYFASILSYKTKFKNFFKGVLFFPYLLNGVAIGFIFLYFFRPGGTLDSVLNALGLGKHIQLWLGNPKIINFSLMGVSVWRYIGFNFVVFLGAIQSISSEIYEAAELDGANKWQQFKYIVFPTIKSIIELNLILSVQGAMSVFEIPYIMTDGANGSMTFAIQTVNTAFKFKKVGLASSMAVILLLITITVTIIQKKLFKEKEA